MIHAGRKRQPYGSGSWVEASFPVSLFWSSFCFLFFSSSPICASIAWDGMDGFAFFPDPFVLHSFLGFVWWRLRGGGIRYISNK